MFLIDKKVDYMKDKARKLILEWIKKQHSVDTLDTQFIDEFERVTGAAVSIKMYGPNHCRYAAKTLNDMYKEGVLGRSCLGITNAPSGFPKWVYSYYMAET